MASATLNGQIRVQGSKSDARKIRREASLPAVLYGLKDNVSLKVNQKELGKVMEKHGHNVLIALTIEGDSTQQRQVIVKDYQRHPLQTDWLHVDFLEIDMHKKTRVLVPVKLVGHSPGEKQGGMVNHAIKEIEVECLPGDIPDVIEINMPDVKLGEVVHVSDLKLSDKLEIMGDPGNAVVSVYVEKVKEKATGEVEGAEGAASPAAKQEKPAAAK
ncbi:MAG: 50S ribosomal protein L25 [Nitrospinae bacterium]|jgi:large subunit ribosomal protein L25|nr:50S ribosomal protein L25 [Nitrospinota bacterium]